MSTFGRLRVSARQVISALERRVWPMTARHAERQSVSTGPQPVDIDRRLADIADEVSVWRKDLEAAVRRQVEAVVSLWERLEFVRRELLYETKYRSSAAAVRVQPRVLRPERLAAARKRGLRLNLGCGHVSLPDYINVDQRDVPGIDIEADLGDLPLPEGGAQEIYSSHVLEHFPQEELRRRLLPYWHRLTASKGLFRAIVPDGEAMLAGLAAGTYPFEDFREVLFGAQEYGGDFHYNLFTPASLQKLLEEAGYGDIEVPFRGRRNGRCFDFEIRARRRD